MTCEEFIKNLPDLNKAEADGDAWCIVFFSKSQDAYQGSYNVDAGDALIVIDELIEHKNLNPQLIAVMQKMDKRDPLP